MEIARWAQLHTTTYHQHLFQHKIRIHDENPSKKWRKIEKHSDKIVAQINFWFKFLNHVPKPLFRNKLLKNNHCHICDKLAVKTITGHEVFNRITSDLFTSQ